MGIYKKKMIIKAYSGFPRLRIRDLMFGDIINWTPGRTVWRPAANWMASAAQRGIIAFQILWIRAPITVKLEEKLDSK